MEFLNFNEAFRDARRAGEKTFMYKGKRYSTDVAGESQKASKSPYEDKSRVMEGVAAKSREMARPGRDAVEGVYPETALIPGRGAASLVATALKAMRADKSGNWRERVPEGADPAKWKSIVKQIDEAYPGGAPKAAKEPSRSMSAEERKAAMMQGERATRSPRSRTREEDNIEYAKGGMAKKKPGYAKGGVIKAMCGASVPAAQKGKK
jgi:hypothetical protein